MVVDKNREFKNILQIFFFLVVHGALDGMNPLGLLGNFTILVTTDGIDLEFFEFGQLQMVSEPDIRRCASEDVGSTREVDCEILHRLERETKHSLCVETPP